jgi:hypothetical protein
MLDERQTQALLFFVFIRQTLFQHAAAYPAMGLLLPGLCPMMA